MKFETIEVSGFEGAIKGMRNPLESWTKSDSFIENNEFKMGSNDLNLAQRLIKAGPEHRKFLRYIHVQFDMTAPLYIWKEFDTYKVGTVANSTSTMHKLASTPIDISCFEIDDIFNLYEVDKDNNIKAIYTDNGDGYWSITESFIELLEELRLRYLETKDKRYWKELIRWLPESWLQTRTIDLNYEVLRTIIRQRTGHKLSEWSAFIKWCHSLPYADELLFDNN